MDLNKPPGEHSTAQAINIELLEAVAKNSELLINIEQNLIVLNEQNQSLQSTLKHIKAH